MKGELIFKRTKEGCKDIIGVIGLTIFWAAIVFGLIGNTILGFVVIGISLLLLTYIFSVKYNFEIRDDGIVFFRILTNKRIDFIDYTKIKQVRFEDSFNTGLRNGNEDRIYIYPKSNSNVKVRSNSSGYIPLTIGERRDETIIRILRCFQSKKVDVKILTSKREIEKQLNLRNWNKS